MAKGEPTAFARDPFENEGEEVGAWTLRALKGAQRVDWLKDVPEDEVLALVRAGRVQLWRDQEMVLTQEQGARCCHLVLEGGLRVLVRRAEGNEFLIGDIGAGETVGLVTLYHGSVFAYSMRALGATLTLRLEREQLEEVVLRHPRSALALLERVSTRFAMTLKFLALTALAPLRDQVHGRLEIWASQQEIRGVPDPHVLHGSQRELAAMMGASRQSVNATLRELEAEGVVKMSYGCIVLLKRLA